MPISGMAFNQKVIMTMNAIRIHEYGDTNVLKAESVAIPQPIAGDVQIRVHAVGINPVDWKTRKGVGIGHLFPQPFPMTLGWDVSGVVSAVGEGVTSVAVGDEVYGMVNFPASAGAYADYVVTPETHIAPKPPSLSHAEAAALPLVTLTAWQSLFEQADLQAGQRVLIHAAAGGVGHVAVQLAKSVGAYVIGTASERNEAYLLELGVDHFINYRSADFAAVLSSDKVDVVLDTMAGDTRERSYGIIKQGGYLVSILGDPSEQAAAFGLKGAGVFVSPSTEQLVKIAALVEAGQLSPTVSQVFPIAKVAEAHALSETGRVRGKLVLEVTP